MRPMKTFSVSLPCHSRLFSLAGVCEQNLDKPVAEAGIRFTGDVAPAHLVYLLLKLSVKFSAA